MKLDPHKRGDTFLLNLQLSNELDQPMVYQLSEMKSQIRRKNNSLVSDVNIELTGEAGVYGLSVPDTAHWPIDEIYMDVKVTHENIIFSTETIIIPVIKDVTQIWAKV